MKPFYSKIINCICNLHWYSTLINLKFYTSLYNTFILQLNAYTIDLLHVNTIHDGAYIHCDVFIKEYIRRFPKDILAFESLDIFSKMFFLLVLSEGLNDIHSHVAIIKV